MLLGILVMMSLSSKYTKINVFLICVPKSKTKEVTTKSRKIMYH